MVAPLINLEQLGWDETWRELCSAYPGRGRPGRITRVDRGLCSVLTSDGPVRATLSGCVLEQMAKEPVAAPCTGDWCLVKDWPDGPVTVEVLLRRRTAVVRTEAGKTSQGQALAVNVDVAAVVVALHPEPRLGRVERLLTLAWESGARPVVLLTKADLVGDAREVAEDVTDAAPGVEVVCCSTVTGQGVADVRRLVGTRGTLALLGASGHGKSSLVNALVGAETLTTKAIRDDGRGRHTSVRRELMLLPGGGAVIDTPGLRGVGLPGAAEGLLSAFPDIEALALQCRFDDCRHVAEPGCAVIAAIESGALAVRRLESWRKLERERESMAGRAEARVRRAGRRRHHGKKGGPGPQSHR